MSLFAEEQEPVAELGTEIVNGAPPPVALTLEYEPTTEAPPLTEAKLGAIPMWVVGVGLLFWAINRYYAEE